MKRSLKSKILLLFGIFTLGTYSNGNPQVVAAAVGVAGGFAANELVKNIIDDLSKQVQLILNQAYQDGNALLANAGNQMSALLQDANYMVKDNVNTTFDRADEQVKYILNEVERIRGTAEDLSNEAFDIKNSAALDVRGILGDNLALLGKKTVFCVQSVRGMTQMYGEKNDYKLDVMGIGFGPDDDNYSSSVISIKCSNLNESISDSVIDKDAKILEVKKNKYSSTINLPNSLINKLITDSTALTQIKVTLTVEAFYTKGVFNRKYSEDFDYSVTLTIFPNTLGDLIVSYEIPDYNWVDSTIYKYTCSTNNHTTGSKKIPHYVVDQKQPVPYPNTRWSRPFVQCSGDGCGWAQCNFVHVDEQNATILHGQFDSWGLPCTFTYGATLQYYISTGMTTKTFIVKRPKYGEILVVTIPKNATYWSIKGQTIDFNNIFIYGSTNPITYTSFNNLITFQNRINSGKNSNLYYQIGTPLLN